MAEPRWPRWAWFVFPALAISIGGGLGYVVGDPERASIAAPAERSRPMVTPIAEPAATAPATTDRPIAADPDPEIELQPDSPNKPATVRQATPRPKHKPKPNKSTPCNVYDHMDGC